MRINYRTIIWLGAFIGMLGAMLLAAPRPFKLTGPLQAGQSTDGLSYYHIGNIIQWRTNDPGMKAHFDSFVGKTIQIHVMEGK